MSRVWDTTSTIAIYLRFRGYNRVNTFLFLEILFISFYLYFDEFKDVLNIVEISSLIYQFVFYILHSFSVLVVKIFESVNNIKILIGDKRFLENSEVEHLSSLKTVFHDLIRKSFKHKHNIKMLIH